MSFDRTYDRIISLGCDCTIKTRILNNLNQKENFISGEYTSDRSFPFDYTVSDNLKFLIKCFQDEFFNFLKFKTLGENIVVNEYDIVFLHHFKIPSFDFISMFERRILRFKKCTEIGNTLFIRSEKIKPVKSTEKLHKDLYNILCHSKNNDLCIFYVDDFNSENKNDNIYYKGYKLEKDFDYIDTYFKSNINKILI